MAKIKLPSIQLENVNIEIRIQSLKAFIDITKTGIQKSKMNEKKRIETLSKNVKDELDLHELRTEEQIYDLEYINYVEGNFECSQIENTATYSIIPSCYMLFETNLVAFANIAKQYYSLNLKYNELRGGKTDKIKKYLSKLANINISEINSWKSLKDLEIIRNCIIHNEGKFNDEFKDKNKLESLIKKYPNDISINKPFYENINYLIIRFSLCEKFLSLLDSFFNDLVDVFGFHQNTYLNSEAVNQVSNEKMKAKKELKEAIKKAKEIYDNRIKLNYYTKTG